MHAHGAHPGLATADYLKKATRQCLDRSLKRPMQDCSMQQIYMQSDEQFEVFTTVFSPKGELDNTHKHTPTHISIL